MSETKTKYTVFPAIGAPTEHEIDWPYDPGYDRLKQLIEPLVKGPLEHVVVLHDDKRRDMFVNEQGHILKEPLQRNDKATEIYRAATLRRSPNTKPESLPHIVGTAVLFHRLVWF